MLKLTNTYKLIIFDWDGTLSDSCGQIVEAVKLAARELKLPEVSGHEIRLGIGLSYAEQVHRLYGEDVSLPAFRQFFEKAYYSNFKCPEPPLFACVEKLLLEIKQNNGLIAIATGKSRSGLDASLSYFGLAKYFDMTVCSGEAASKPSPDMINMILNHLDYQSSEAVMIGDTLNDCYAAKSAGVAFIGVASGGKIFAEQLQKESPFLLVNEVKDLLEYK